MDDDKPGPYSALVRRESLMPPPIKTRAPALQRVLKVFEKRGFKAESDRARKAETVQRAEARNILGTDTIRDKDISAAKLLMTTLGGELRAITRDDLETFAANVRKLGKRFKGGITAKGVIDFSLQVDRDRANEQIRTAVVVRAQAGRLHFITNAGPGSPDLRHHVHVEFPTFKALSASPQDPRKLAKTMLEGPLAFDCDCGRHRYWFRFIATKGGFAAGRPETGFPKIRNPKLVGVACKHALRVMPALLKDPTVRAQAAKMIAAAQANDVKAQVLKPAEAKAIAEQQIKQSAYLRNQAETTRQQADRRAMSAATRGKVKAVAASVATARKKAAAQDVKAEAIIAKMLKSVGALGLTPAQVASLVNKAVKAKA